MLGFKPRHCSHLASLFETMCLVGTTHLVGTTCLVGTTQLGKSQDQAALEMLPFCHVDGARSLNHGLLLLS